MLRNWLPADALGRFMTTSRLKQNMHLFVAATAAFCTYFCMYAFRKPFTAGTFEGQQVFGAALKTVLIISQILGYMVSKFIGIRLISEMQRKYRAIAIVGLIAIAELALVGFAFLPVPLKVPMMFLNGLPLGMVFGLVLAYLEGRRHTEALSAALCASFIVSSGVVKSVGQWLIIRWGVSEFHMPMVAGALFLAPLLVSVWFLNATPPPDNIDKALRAERNVMKRAERQQFVVAYWPGLLLLMFVYIVLTVVRTVRDDFGVEIWRDLGVRSKPEVFTYAETTVAVFVTALNAMTILITSNLLAIRATLATMCLAFGLVAASALLQSFSMLSPFVFMVGCGIGLYVPYVAFHTTVFERLIAASKRPCNLGFLMYLADSVGYLGYVAILLVRTAMQPPQQVLPSFRIGLLAAATSSILALVAATVYFQRYVGAREVHVSRSSVPLTE